MQERSCDHIRLFFRLFTCHTDGTTQQWHSILSGQQAAHILRRHHRHCSKSIRWDSIKLHFMPLFRVGHSPAIAKIISLTCQSEAAEQKSARHHNSTNNNTNCCAAPTAIPTKCVPFMYSSIDMVNGFNAKWYIWFNACFSTIHSAVAAHARARSQGSGKTNFYFLIKVQLQLLIKMFTWILTITGIPSAAMPICTGGARKRRSMRGC